MGQRLRTTIPVSAGDFTGMPVRHEELVSDGLVSIAAAMRFLTLSRSTVYQMMDNGALMYVKLGRARRIPKRALVELAARNLRGGWNGSAI